MYRLSADIFNDTAMVFDCLSPGFPKTVRVAVLSVSSVLRACCGVCAGSAKGCLSAHFARRGNLGEVNAVSVVLLLGKWVPGCFLLLRWSRGSVMWKIAGGRQGLWD
jgi:hypothetical protein